MGVNDGFYKNLGVNPDASPEEIKAAFRKLAHQHHPDKGGDPEQFKRVFHSYKVLTDPSYRYRDEPRLQPIQIQVMISLEQAVFGCTITNLVRKQRVNATQEGKKEYKGKSEFTVLEVIDKLPPRLSTFPYVVKHPQLNFGDSVHDVEIFYGLNDHPYYKMDPRLGLVVTIKVDLYMALKGGKVEVETLFGLRTLRIPAGLEPNEVLTIRNHGDLGVLHVKVDIVYPKRQERKQDRKKWAEVADVDWEKEQQLDVDEEADLAATFNRLVR